MSEVLEIAKEMGYDPEYNGDDKKTPEEFIKYGAKIQRNQSQKIKDLLNRMDSMSSEFEKMNRTFSETLTAQQEKHKVELERQKTEIEAKMERAVDEADTAEFKRLQSQMKTLEKQERDIKPVATKSSDELIFEKWKADGRSFLDTDVEAAKEFQIALAEIRIKKNGRADLPLPVNEELDHIDSHLKKVYPERFGLKKEEKPPAGGPGEGKAKGDKAETKLTYKQLSETEKQQYDSWMRSLGKGFNPETLLNSFSLARKARGEK